jgi:ATP-dependent protease ClpP protease subunit
MPRRLLKPHEVLNLHRGQKGWYSIRNHAGHDDQPAEIRLYGIIGWDVTAGDFLNELATISAAAIDVHIATDGGDVNDGIAILNALRAHPADITTVNDAQALSAGSFIMQAGDTRVMMPNSTMMIHDAMVGFAYAEGNAKDLRDFAADVLKYADLLDRTSDNIAQIYADRTGKGDMASWRQTMLDETWYSAQEAVSAGLADSVWVRADNRAKPPAPEPADLVPDPWDIDPEQLARIMREAFQDA